MMDLFELAPTFDDPIGMLRACHRRIERALDVIARVAEREHAGALDAEAREALRRTLHYFNTGVPRHAADEEESLFPRLRGATGKPLPCGSVQNPPLLETLRKLQALEAEHARADAAHRELDALGERLLETGQFERADDRVRFGELIAELKALYEEHIRIEDEELFPLAAKLVDAQEQEIIGTEMAHRRGIDRDRHREIVARLEDQPWSLRPERKG
jgi:hemerythrin-like domain-containing protein